MTSWVFDLIDLIAMRGGEGLVCLYDDGTEKSHWDVGSTLVNPLIMLVFPIDRYVIESIYCIS